MPMKLLRGLAEVPYFADGSVAAIGNFDGVHLGHQALLAALRAQADALQLPMVALVFEPQPAEYFRGLQAPARLTTLREKSQVLQSCGVDYLCCLKFNEAFALLSAEDFAERYFFSWLHAKYLLIGEDFRFGYKRLGDIQLLKLLGEKEGCSVETFPDFSVNHHRVSSTKIREALAQGQLEYASALLGRTFNLCGRVVKGNERGRQWGIPTANLTMHRLALPLKGVFCVKVRRASGEWLEGVANIGSRPTVDGTKNILEIHLFDFDGDLYGEMLQVFFLHKLRDEVRFSSIEALIKQIHEDIAVAKAQFCKRRFELNALTE
ncbi:bifunctional riboflavin kinase/FAD synthetase [Legionella micdadei]|uniref:Riboflavin biosynthesis protein n=2 Tax=Legionella micdadei TaxID=451 RepID=A0A098GDD9_LEGMI|nr:bifunctional riboflavin kinase/FAD synthetase [Legionella micdadei]KTD28594.1 riboflavin biosynthesis protein RibF (riboflavin kinase/FMN adenylyltransferase) [Legionella micdadei]CEG60513.1 Riboflavin biosynthesis protein ribF [Includes: Riboflavin kinase; FMN adenylyltransferase] [Legionella micdadei]SCX80378.1 riboflavin kinase / FMN adenylyltransferase [Legionella micdadei]